jgi:hypothetical protein
MKSVSGASSLGYANPNTITVRQPLARGANGSNPEYPSYDTRPNTIRPSSQLNVSDGAISEYDMTCYEPLYPTATSDSEEALVPDPSVPKLHVRHLFGGVRQRTWLLGPDHHHFFKRTDEIA